MTDEGIRKVFNRLDTSSDGYLDVKEIRICLNELFIDATQKDVERLMNNILEGELKKGGKINFEQFQNFVKNREVELLNIFKELDVNDDGIIIYQDLENYLSKQNYIEKYKITPLEIKKMFRSLDRNRDGKIDFVQWRR